jgi:hypothetical protein
MRYIGEYLRIVANFIPDILRSVIIFFEPEFLHNPEHNSPAFGRGESGIVCFLERLQAAFGGYQGSLIFRKRGQRKDNIGRFTCFSERNMTNMLLSKPRNRLTITTDIGLKKRSSSGAKINANPNPVKPRMKAAKKTAYRASIQRVLKISKLCMICHW